MHSAFILALLQSVHLEVCNRNNFTQGCTSRSACYTARVIELTCEFYNDAHSLSPTDF